MHNLDLIRYFKRYLEKDKNLIFESIRSSSTRQTDWWLNSLCHTLSMLYTQTHVEQNTQPLISSFCGQISLTKGHFLFYTST